VGTRENSRTRYGEIPVVGESWIGEIAGTIRVYRRFRFLYINVVANALRRLSVNESIKLKNSILDTFEKVMSDTFQESDIKALLVDIREYIRDQTLLRELADFIAHPKRDKGICYKLLNARYAKLLLFEEQIQRIDREGGIEKLNIKNEFDYSNAVLSSLSVDRIKSDLFKILFVDGIEDIEDKVLRKYYKVGKSEILRFLNNSYFQVDGYHILKNLKSRNLIDDILKFIRGYVSGNTAFKQTEFNNELETSIKRVIEKFKIDNKYLEVFKTHRSKILVCIMCLLHDARLTFYNKNEGRIYLTTNDKSLALATDNTIFKFYLFVSDIKIHYYLEQGDKYEHSNMGEIPWINARRDKNNRLLLMT